MSTADLSFVSEADSGRSPAIADDRGSAGVLDQAPRAAAGVFAGASAVAFGLYLWFGREQWFWWDEWELLAGRSGRSIDDVLRPYHGHWIGTPTLLYRGLYSLFGLHSYFPYQVMIVSAHLAVAALLRVVMRRAGVAPWIATIVAGVFLFFGTGKQNIMWGFQIAFTGAVLFGLVQLLLVDHEGRIDWRDLLGLVAGLVGLACSGVGVVMVFAVGLATLLRRGVVAALVQVVPLTVVFAFWWYGYGRHDTFAVLTGDATSMRRFVVSGLVETLRSVGHVTGVVWLLCGMLLVGLVVAWWHPTRRHVIRRAAQPLSLAIGAVLFLAITAWGRAVVSVALTGTIKIQYRYQHIVLALLLPAIAVAADALVRRWRATTYVVVPLLLVGLPYNVSAIWHRDDVEKGQLGEPALFNAVAQSPMLDGAPDEVRPFPEGQIGEDVVTVGWLRAARDAGKLPDPLPIGAYDARSAAVRLGLLEQDATIPTTGCRTMAATEQRHLEPGSSVVLLPGAGGRLTASVNVPGYLLGAGANYNLWRTSRFTVVGGPLDITFRGPPSAQICD